MLGLIKEGRMYALEKLKELASLYWQKSEKCSWDWILIRVPECNTGWERIYWHTQDGGLNILARTSFYCWGGSWSLKKWCPTLSDVEIPDFPGKMLMEGIKRLREVGMVEWCKSIRFTRRFVLQEGQWDTFTREIRNVLLRGISGSLKNSVMTLIHHGCWWDRWSQSWSC